MHNNVIHEFLIGVEDISNVAIGDDAIVSNKIVDAMHVLIGVEDLSDDLFGISDVAQFNDNINVVLTSLGIDMILHMGHETKYQKNFKFYNFSQT